MAANRPYASVPLEGNGLQQVSKKNPAIAGFFVG